MTTDEIAEEIIRHLRGKVIIHRYNAFSTHSVYLKFDYGAANSLRVSDHQGKRYLEYRYNIILDLDKPYIDETGKYPREFYPPSMVGDVVAQVLTQKEIRQKRWADYNAIVKKLEQKAQHSKSSFWKCSKKII